MYKPYRILFEQDDPPATPPADPPATPPPDSDPPNDPAPVPYAKFAEQRQELQTLKSDFAKLQAEIKKANDSKLADQQKWQELAEQRQKELDDQKAALEAEKLERLRLQVASSKGLPVDLAGRLSGTTEEELNADADKLLAFIKPATGPGVPVASTKPNSTKTLDFSKMSAEDIRKQFDGKSVNEVLS